MSFKIQATGCTPPSPQQGSKLLLLCAAVVWKTTRVQHEIRFAVAVTFDSLLKQNASVWLLFCCISDRVAAQ